MRIHGGVVRVVFTRGGVMCALLLYAGCGPESVQGPKEASGPEEASSADPGGDKPLAEARQALRTYQVDVFVMTGISTCAIGDFCTSGPDSCFTFRDITTGNPQFSFQNNSNFTLVHPDDPRRKTAPQELCLNLTTQPSHITEIRAQLDAIRDYVLANTGGDVGLNFVVHEVPPTAMTMQPIPEFLAIALTPLDLKLSGVLQGRLSAATDFIMGTVTAADLDRNLRAPVNCGLAFGYQPPMAGAPYFWVPKTGPSGIGECAEREVIIHEWLHLVDGALDEISGFDDIYRDGLPECGTQDPDPHKWFPSSDECTGDPDWEACGADSCGPTIEPYNRHILNAHWDPARPFFANYCKNGVQDSKPRFDETGVDVGPSCLGSAGAPVAICMDVIVDAGSSCTASVSSSQVNNGSFDPDGGAVTCTLSPSGPYRVGTQAVTLTCTDDEGDTGSCTANIHVNLGNNQKCCPSGTRRIDGRGGNDTIVGGFGNDFITGRNGDDTIDAGSDNDKVGGGGGRDSITAGRP